MPIDQRMHKHIVSRQIYYDKYNHTMEQYTEAEINGLPMHTTDR